MNAGKKSRSLEQRIRRWLKETREGQQWLEVLIVHQELNAEATGLSEAYSSFSQSGNDAQTNEIGRRAPATWSKANRLKGLYQLAATSWRRHHAGDFSKTDLPSLIGAQVAALRI